MRPAQQNRRMRGRGNNNNNNNRKGPNPLSRNYESNGPDVKIRGNAQHIAEKYAALARDAQVSGDRVMAENYLQHAEHYNRIILAAMAQNPVPFQREENFGDEMGDDEEGGFAPNGAVHQPVNGHGPQPVIDGTPAEVVYGDDAGEQQPRSDYRQPRDNRDQRQPRDNRDQRQPREARQYRDDREPREGYEQREGREDRQQRDGREQRRFGRDRRPQRERFGASEERNDQVAAEQAVTPEVAEVVAAPVAIEEVAAPKVEAPQIETPVVENVAEVAAPKAPTRGRPRRAVAPVETSADSDAAPAEAKAALEAPATEEEAPKRRPGRPRRTATKDVNEEA